MLLCSLQISSCYFRTPRTAWENPSLMVPFAFDFFLPPSCFFLFAGTLQYGWLSAREDQESFSKPSAPKLLSSLHLAMKTPRWQHTHTSVDDEKRIFIGWILKALSAKGLTGVIRHTNHGPPKIHKRLSYYLAKTGSQLQKHFCGGMGGSNE